MPKNIPDCQAKVSQLLEAIIMIATTQRLIDNEAINDYKGLPDSCVPELFRDKEEQAEGECPVIGDVEIQNMKHRQWAKEKLLELADEMRGPPPKGMENNWYPYTILTDPRASQAARDSVAITEIAFEIDVQDKEPLTHLPDINELVSENIFRMFTEFDSCMKEK